MTRRKQEKAKKRIEKILSVWDSGLIPTETELRDLFEWVRLKLKGAHHDQS